VNEKGGSDQFDGWVRCESGQTCEVVIVGLCEVALGNLLLGDVGRNHGQTRVSNWELEGRATGSTCFGETRGLRCSMSGRIARPNTAGALEFIPAFSKFYRGRYCLISQLKKRISKTRLESRDCSTNRGLLAVRLGSLRNSTHYRSRARRNWLILPAVTPYFPANSFVEQPSAKSLVSCFMRRESDIYQAVISSFAATDSGTDARLSSASS
jgi:hypothetical protein